jgi:hypothetical protein
MIARSGANERARPHVEPDRMSTILTITPTPEARFERVSGAAGSMTTIEITERRLFGRGVSPAG